MGGAPRARRARALHAREHGLLGTPCRTRLEGRRQRARHGHEARGRAPRVRRHRDDVRDRHRAGARAGGAAGARRDERSTAASSRTRSPRDHVIAGSSTARRFCEHNGARHRGRPGAFLGARPPTRVLRRPRWHAVSRRGHRRDLALPARGQREHRRAVRDEPADDRARRAGAREGRIVPRLLGGRDRVRAEHDRAQLPAEPRLRTDAARGRRDRRHRARPRRERVTVARAGT